MKIVAVVGTGSGCGKTTIACRILREVPGLGAVKISPRDGVSRIEWGAGAPDKDTDLFARNGAVPVARIVGPRESVVQSWEQIKGHFDGCRGVVIEGESALGVPGERLIVFVVGDTQTEPRTKVNWEIREQSAIIIERSSHFYADSLVDTIRTFLTGATND